MSISNSACDEWLWAERYRVFTEIQGVPSSLFARAIEGQTSKYLRQSNVVILNKSLRYVMFDL